MAKSYRSKAPSSSHRLFAFAALLVAGAAACASVSAPPADDGAGGVRGGTGSGGRVSGGTGAGGGRGGGGGGLINANDGGMATCGLQFFDLERKPAVVMLVLDRSGSMLDNLMGDSAAAGEPTKWSQLIPALSMTIPRIAGDISWGLKTFPEGGTGSGTPCTLNSVTTNIDVPVTSMNASALVSAIGKVEAKGDGTPTGVAVKVATDYLRMLPAEARKYILLATDGQPSCKGTITTLSEDTSSAKDYARPEAVAAVQDAYNAGIHTFVIGLVVNKNDTNTLNMLAMAGGEQTGDGNPFAPAFYQASSQTELTTALEAITGVFSTCIFPLKMQPPVPDKIAVKVSGMKAPPSASDGWSYSKDDFSEITVNGSWCEMIRTTAANKVEIIFGCPDIDIP